MFLIIVHIVCMTKRVGQLFEWVFLCLRISTDDRLRVFLQTAQK
jgi:hypothetical protein